MLKTFLSACVFLFWSQKLSQPHATTHAHMHLNETTKTAFVIALTSVELSVSFTLFSTKRSVLNTFYSIQLDAEFINCFQGIFVKILGKININLPVISCA